MTSQAKTAYPAVLSKGGDPIAELTDIGGVKISVDKKEVTNADSTGGYEESIPGLIHVGDIAIEGNFIEGDTDGQIEMYAALNSKAVETYKVTLPAATGVEWTFTAWVKDWEVDTPQDGGPAKFKGAITVTGKPVLAIGESDGLTTPFLSFSAGSIIPAADQDILEYVLAEATGVATITITPTAAAGVITITANGVTQTVISGNASTAIALGAPDSVIDVVIEVKETGKIAKPYTLHVSRAAP